MIWLQIGYCVFCVVLAAANADMIGDGKKINHFWNGLWHFIAATLGTIFWGWMVGVIILCEARVVFDSSLNLMRGLPIDYVSIKPASIVDKVEKRIFGMNGILPKLMYLLIAGILNFIYFN